MSFFEEKSTQITPSSFIAFGLSITSRYGKSSEIIQMINFAELLAKNLLTNYVISVAYDSKCGFCDIEFNIDNVLADHIKNKIYDLARIAEISLLADFVW